MSRSGSRSTRTRRLALSIAVATFVALIPGASTSVAAESPVRHGDMERLGRRLLNCTRTGGWVRADGTCKGRGSGAYSAVVPALPLHEGISDRVAYPWSVALVSAQECAHSLPGEPELARRFTLAGFNYPYFGENLGCGWGGTPRDMVIRTHRMMQAEKWSKGGHWRNIKERGYKSVGIGVASLDGWTTIVYDFYGR